MPTRANFVPARDTCESRLAKSDVFLNPMIHTDPAISNTYVTLALELCKITATLNFTVLWLTNHRLILTITGRTRQVISPSWFT